MTEINPTPRNLRWDGNSPDHLEFSMDSFTRKGMRHDQRIDRRTGVVECTCEDSVCRRKRGDVLRWHEAGRAGGCIHIRALFRGDRFRPRHARPVRLTRPAQGGDHDR